MTKKIGAREVFQIKCIRDPLHGQDGHVFGRMCLRFGDGVLGDFDEPACMLDVTAGHFEDVLNSLLEPDGSELSALADADVWERIDSALYKDDSRTIAQIVADAKRYRRYNFLTNGGESFDNAKSFFVASAHDVRILFREHEGLLQGKTVDRAVFVETLRAWLAWLNAEKKNIKSSQ